MIKTDTGEYPIFSADLRNRFPNTSFPANLSDEHLSEIGYAIVQLTPMPETDVFHSVIELPPVEVNGEYIQRWEVVALEGDELDLKIAEIRAKNKQQAQAKQDEALTLLAINEQKKALGLAPAISNEEEVKAFAKTIQAEIDYPSEASVYNPTLPPGVNPPDVSSIIITLTREPGWNDVIGWRAVITAGAENFTPTNLAMAEYTNPNCDGYLYTTGAFQQDGDTWYAVCPAGQEKGDVDVNLGLLYGAAQLACFTFTAGEQEMTVYAYEE
jgi:hypothetical protein